jgi:rubrerythrin
MREVNRLGAGRIAEFDRSMFRPIEAIQVISGNRYICDRCGHEMYEQNCKITCSNCGNRFDCSDLSIYFD